MKRTALFALFLVFLLPAALPSFAEKVSTTPAPTGYIDDYAQVFSADGKSDMEALCRELHDKTKAQVFVVTINTTEGEPVETFANELFAKWKIGEKKTDRGVLMLFAIKDRKRWIEIGYGLEGILNDAKVGDIGRTMIPALKAANYDEAAQTGLRQITQIIAADAGVTLDALSTPTQEEAAPAPVSGPAPSSESLSRFRWLFLVPFLTPSWSSSLYFGASSGPLADAHSSAAAPTTPEEAASAAVTAAAIASAAVATAGAIASVEATAEAPAAEVQAETGKQALLIPRTLTYQTERPAHRAGLRLCLQPTTSNLQLTTASTPRLSPCKVPSQPQRSYSAQPARQLSA
jgi:uncharacterized protein